MRARGVVGFLGAADVLGDRAHHRQSDQGLGDESAEALGFGNRGAGHSRHVKNEMPFLEFGQEGATEERKGGTAGHGKNQSGSDRRTRMDGDAAQNSLITPARPANDGRLSIMRDRTRAFASSSTAGEQQHRERRRHRQRHNK